MTAKTMDNHNRWRSKTVAFRMSPEETNQLDAFVQMSGLPKQDYLKSLYGVKPDDRIFDMSKSYLHHEMDRGAKAAGVKRIRIHDLRHSHISLLIDMGFSEVAIAERVGHESIDITYRYAHLFPTRQTDMVQQLELKRAEGGF